MRKIAFCLVLLIFTLAGCQAPADESRSREESVLQGESASQESTVAQEIEVLKTQECDIAWEQIEFALDIDALGFDDIVERICSDEQAKEMARAIIERCHEKQMFPDWELVYMKHYTQDDFWLFGYSIDQSNTAVENLIDCGGFYVAIDGGKGTVIKAWMEE